MWHANVFRKLEYINKNVDEYLKTPRQENCYEKDSAISMAKIPLPTFDGNIRHSSFQKRL